MCLQFPLQKTCGSTYNPALRYHYMTTTPPHPPTRKEEEKSNNVPVFFPSKRPVSGSVHNTLSYYIVFSPPNTCGSVRNAAVSSYLFPLVLRSTQSCCSVILYGGFPFSKYLWLGPQSWSIIMLSSSSLRYLTSLQYDVCFFPFEYLWFSP